MLFPVIHRTLGRTGSEPRDPRHPRPLRSCGKPPPPPTPRASLRLTQLAPPQGCRPCYIRAQTPHTGCSRDPRCPHRRAARPRPAGSFSARSPLPALCSPAAPQPVGLFWAGLASVHQDRWGQMWAGGLPPEGPFLEGRGPTACGEGQCCPLPWPAPGARVSCGSGP